MKISKFNYAKPYWFEEEFGKEIVVIPKVNRAWAKRNTFALDIEFIKDILKEHETHRI